MRESIAETLTGFLVLAVAGVFAFMAMGYSEKGAGTSSELYGAKFSNVGGLATGTEVKLAGVKIGSIRSIVLDPDTYEAQVIFTVRGDLALGDATSIRVQSDALLGGSYLGIEPGDGFGMIEPCEGEQQIFDDSGCGEILYAQGTKDLVALALSALGGGGDDSSDE